MTSVAARRWAVRPVERPLPDGPVSQTPAARTALRRLLETGSVCVLTGAGISTESGIPDYRDRTAGAG